MCGITGWYRRDGVPVTRDVVLRQCRTLIHRGPDDSGTHTDGDFGFGMRRLSIIDVAGGHQPITAGAGRFSVVCNGEIVNHLDLRPELEAEGFAFSTQSDIETLLASYVCWGDRAWRRLEGMYAAAIWDARDRTLTLARDPLGIKPLYLTRQANGLAFASEIRALLTLPRHHFDIDERALREFFTFGHVQRPRSIYRQVFSLNPGTWLRIGPDGEPVQQAFWTPRFSPIKGLSEQEWVEATQAEVRRTVRQHMLADVPVGSFLSGGVDSSGIAAAMSEASSRPVKAFTLGFPGTTTDETAAAARIAQHLSCEHIVLPLEPAVAGDLLPQVQASFDEPCAATAAVPIWHLSRLAAQHVKVVLCGEGADEIFAGYKRQRTAIAAARWRPAMRVLSPLAELLDTLPSSRAPAWNYLRRNARRFIESSRLQDSYERFFAGTQIATPDVRQRLFEGQLQEGRDGGAAWSQLAAEYFSDPQAQRLNASEKFMLGELTVHMPGSLLNRLDRASMAHSLEARVPFLSHRFVDWALTMPTEMKLRGGVGKYALRKAVAPWLPPGALSRKKLGFQLPFAEWFRGGFSDFAQEAWHESGARDAHILRSDAVDTLFAEHRAGVANHGRMLYAIAMFGCWWNQTKAGLPLGGETVSPGRAA